MEQALPANAASSPATISPRVASPQSTCNLPQAIRPRIHVRHSEPPDTLLCGEPGEQTRELPCSQLVSEAREVCHPCHEAQQRGSCSGDPMPPSPSVRPVNGCEERRHQRGHQRRQRQRPVVSVGWHWSLVSINHLLEQQLEPRVPRRQQPDEQLAERGEALQHLRQLQLCSATPGRPVRPSLKNTHVMFRQPDCLHVQEEALHMGSGRQE